MKVYKVTTNFDDTYQSVFLFGTRFSLEYVPGRWTCAMVGKLFAFNRLEGVRQFLASDVQHLFQVWEADAKHVKKCKRILDPDIAYLGGFSMDAMRIAWASQAQFSHPAPTGSVTASAIKLLKEVKV